MESDVQIRDSEQKHQMHTKVHLPPPVKGMHKYNYCYQLYKDIHDDSGGTSWKLDFPNAGILRPWLNPEFLETQIFVPLQERGWAAYAQNIMKIELCLQTVLKQVPLVLPSVASSGRGVRGLKAIQIV